MDKTEMYNKIINAIDVLSRVEGKPVDVKQESDITSYSLGDISLLLKDAGVQLHICGVDLTRNVERLDVIYSSLRRIYDRQEKSKQEQELEKVKSYLNSFVGK